MSEFNLQKCIAGEATETKIGQRIYFIAYDENLNAPLLMRIGQRSLGFSKDGKYLPYSDDTYDLRMADQKKKVDLSKLPIDTLLVRTHDIRHFSAIEDNMINFFAHGATSLTADGTGNCFAKDVSIHPNQPWTFWQGGKCPIPDGLEFEVVFRSGGTTKETESASSLVWTHHNRSTSDIIAYRLTGKVLDGWELERGQMFDDPYDYD